MALIDSIVDSLTNRPEEWSTNGSGYTIDHKSGLGLWVGNGFFFLDIHEPFEAKLSLLEKWRVWKAINKCGRAQAASLLEKGKP